ncbi:hypothetical protein JOC37_000407 [Desulfohalotomaculum tongense]|uniref:hypothetical protein n=1 Tax=Desulforadius tongensis TaxID=1216062 RepID=UPI0019585DF3|nr:hypothetical protein [Desulforadius tongensis]MBM7854035.1 hypothetical protein [Desulforadius tongensis]
MKKRLLEGLTILLLVSGGLYWYSCSHSVKSTAALYALSFISKQRYSDYAVEFTYPASWQVSEMPVEGSEVLHHVSYCEPGNRIHGFVQVWAAGENWEQFLKDSIARAPADGTQIEDVSMKPGKIGDKEGYLVTYTRAGKRGTAAAREFFFIRDKRVYRTSLFAPKQSWSDKDIEIFNDLVSSLRVKY